MVANEAAVILCSLLVLCSTLAAGKVIKVGNCTKIKTFDGKLLSVDMDPCPAEPCVFHRGTNVTATIEFSPEVMVADGTLEVYGIIAGIKEKFPLEQPDACKGHKLECPLKSGQEYSLVITLPIKPQYPLIELIAQMDFIHPDEKYLFCFQFPMKIAE